MFGLKGIMAAGSGLFGRMFSFAGKSADDALNAVGKKHLNTLTDDFITTNGRIPTADEVVELTRKAGNLAENSSASFFKKALSFLGIGAAVGGTGLAIDAAVRGDESLAAEGLQNLMTAGKNPDARSDMEGLWERIIAFFKEGYRQITKALGMSTPEYTTTVADENTPPPSNSDNESFANTFTKYANGLAEDFDPSQWSIKSSLNIVNAAGNGAVVGVTSTLAWAGGQALDIINVGDWFSDRDFSTEAAQGAENLTNKAWDSTIGAPDLSGHWAHAVNKVSGFAVPTVGALKIGKALSQTFGLVNATTKTARAADITVRNAPSIMVNP